MERLLVHLIFFVKLNMNNSAFVYYYVQVQRAYRQKQERAKAVPEPKQTQQHVSFIKDLNKFLHTSFVGTFRNVVLMKNTQNNFHVL